MTGIQVHPSTVERGQQCRLGKTQQPLATSTPSKRLHMDSLDMAENESHDETYQLTKDSRPSLGRSER